MGPGQHAAQGARPAGGDRRQRPRLRPQPGRLRPCARTAGDGRAGAPDLAGDRGDLVMATASTPRYTVDITAPANGRLRQQEVELIDRHGKTVNSDKGDLRSA